MLLHGESTRKKRGSFDELHRDVLFQSVHPI